MWPRLALIVLLALPCQGQALPPTDRPFQRLVYDAYVLDCSGAMGYDTPCYELRTSKLGAIVILGSRDVPPIALLRAAHERKQRVAVTFVRSEP